VTYIAELVEVAAANPDRSFYTAESFGLQTPRNPYVWRLLWIGAGAVFVVLAIVAFVRLRRRR
jgi:hypothetical protein